MTTYKNLPLARVLVVRCDVSATAVTGRGKILYKNTRYGIFCTKSEEQKNCVTEMANFGEKSLELIRESVRARDMLGPFNEEKVRLVLEEIKVLMEDVS